MFIVSTPSKLCLYSIPDLHPIEDNSPHMVDAVPLGIYEEGNVGGSTSIWNILCAHHVGGQSIAGLTDELESLLVILPQTGQSEPSIVRHVIQQCDMGPRSVDLFLKWPHLLKLVSSRVIWVKPRETTGKDLELASCTHLTKPDTHPGYMRFGHDKAPDPSRLVSIPLIGDTDMSAVCITWDEQTGRICIQSSVTNNPRCKYLGIIDLL